MAELLNLDDDDLLRLMEKGDERAFATVYERRQGAVYTFALHMSGNAAIAEEVTQEVFLHLIRDSKKYDPQRGSLAAYLYGVTRNFVRRWLEQDQACVPMAEDFDDSAAALTGGVDILSDLTRSESIERLRHAIFALPANYREVVVLCDLEEMDYAEAAAVLGCTLGTLSCRLHRARALLVEKMKVLSSVRR